VTHLRRLPFIAGLLTALVGVVHVSVGIAQYDWPNFDALWFHGTGMGLLLAGGLTMLAASARAWRELGIVAAVGNLLGLCLAIAFGVLSHWGTPQGPVLMTLFALGALGSVPAIRQP
jgi:hypothetical protein